MSYLVPKRTDVTATYDGAVAINSSLLTPLYQPKQISAIALNPFASSVVIGNSVTIKAIISPDDAADKTLSWSLSDDTLATITVSEDTITATIEGAVAGPVIVTATANDDSGISASTTIVVTEKDASEPVAASYDSWDLNTDNNSLTGKVNGKVNGKVLTQQGANAPVFDSIGGQIFNSEAQSSNTGLDSGLEMSVVGQTFWAVFRAPASNKGAMIMGANNDGEGGFGVYKRASLTSIRLIFQWGTEVLIPSDNFTADSDYLFVALSADTAGYTYYGSTIGSGEQTVTPAAITDAKTVGFGPLTAQTGGDWKWGPYLVHVGIANEKYTADQLAAKYAEVKAHLAATVGITIL